MNNALNLRFAVMLMGMFSACLEAHNDPMQSSGWEMLAHFADPPAECRPGTYWWWYNGAVTREEVARELGLMKDVGLHFAHIVTFDGRQRAVPGHEPAKIASPEWSERITQCIKDAAAIGMKIDLDLGIVRDAARIELNGKDLGIVIETPYRLTIPPNALKEGENHLTVRVCNLMENAITPLLTKSASGKRSWSGPFIKPEDLELLGVLHPSGLLGPVTIQSTERTPTP